MQIIFQDPYASLNPRMTVESILAEPLEIHEFTKTKHDKQQRIYKLLDRQRVMIAMALSCNPNILIADEPTTALDVTIQAQILDLLKGLQDKVGMGMILITHDLGVVAEVADEVVVMYAGQVAEQGTVREIFKNPKHPYTKGLLNSIPTLSKDPTGKMKKKRLETIPGIVPNLLYLPKGCRFQDRCPYVLDECRMGPIQLRKIPAKIEDAETPHAIRCIRDI
jgi:oligopeptide/dipeptide ABC transporter ATP-binding protein